MAKERIMYLGSRSGVSKKGSNYTINNFAQFIVDKSGSLRCYTKDFFSDGQIVDENKIKIGDFVKLHFGDAPYLGAAPSLVGASLDTKFDPLSYNSSSTSDSGNNDMPF